MQQNNKLTRKQIKMIILQKNNAIKQKDNDYDKI